MSRVSSIIGSVVASIAWEQLRPVEGRPRPALRATGFSAEEVGAIILAIQALELEFGASPFIVRVGAYADAEGVPAQYLLQSGETLTYWRNAEVAAILLIDWDVQGDEEGLAAVNRLDDVGVLAGRDEDATNERFRLLADQAWAACGGALPPPGALLKNLEIVRDSVGSQSLRNWTGFVASSCALALAAPLRTPDAIGVAVGSSLSHLGLFPDRTLFEDRAVARTRLGRNANVSGGLQPGGGTITEDDLLRLIDTTEFGPGSLVSLGLTDLQARTLMRQFALGRSADARARLDVSLWLELFERRADPLRLGQMVREEIARIAKSRLDEFDNLDVEAGLDHSEQSAAEKLLRAEPPGAQRSLIDTLSSRLRRRVEKLAFPDAQIEADPLRALLHAVHVLDDEFNGEVVLDLEEVPEEGDWSRWLFALLYGPSLTHLSDATSEARLSLRVDPRLIGLERPRDPDPDEDFETARAWAPLRLRVTMPDASRRRFRWDPQANPGPIAFAALLDVGVLRSGHDAGCDLEAFFERLTDPRNWDSLAPSTEPIGSIAEQMADLQRRHFEEWRVSGLFADAIEQYIAEWEPLITDARASLIPANAPNEALSAVVLSNVVQLDDGRLLMLATHPLRLRWVARHLIRMHHLLLHAFSDGLRLNKENSELFFEWLDRVSPHGTPPLAVGRDETVAIATRESGWHEEYVPISQSGSERRDWLAAVDDAAIEELVKVIVAYLDTYPYKMDGLSLLLLDRDGSSRLPLRLAVRLRNRKPGVRMQLHVLAETTTHLDIVQAFDSEFADLELSEEQLLPDVQLVLRAWPPDSEPDFSDLIDQVDLALAPAVFGTRTSLSPKTRDTAAGIAGSYDPWIHRSTHDLAESGQNVVRVMLPSQRDPLLETWSTLCVRHDRYSAVAPQQESNTDYFELLVRFDRHQALFAQLHRVAHWVVTLDAFIGRDQIDALESKPDVILVRPGVGKNESYTLIVSSATGRRFVVQRLSRKLALDLGFADHPDICAVASRIYEVGRNVVPGAVLRALGLGRAANEVLGLVVSRYAVSQRKPVPEDKPGMVVWLSFDEQQSWFGRSLRTRADLGRFVFLLDDSGMVHLQILVVESKFRRVFDIGLAEAQLDRTTELVLGAFAVGSPGSDDADFWMQELASAIEQTSALQAPPCDLPSRRSFGPHRESLETTILQCIRSGRVRLDSVNGIAVAIASQADQLAPGMSPLGGHELVRLNKPELRQIIQDLVNLVDPSASQRPEGGSPGMRSSGVGPAPDTGHGLDALVGAEGPRPELGPQADAGDAVTETLAGADVSVGIGSAGLQQRYERLLDVLAQHGVQVAAPHDSPWREGPGFYVLRVVPRTGVTVDRVVNRVNEVSLALALPTGSHIRTSLDLGAIVFEVPKSDPERYPVLARHLWTLCPVEHDRLTIPLGADIQGVPVQLDFSSPDSPHLLVAGTTGSGKSVALETILRGLCRYPAETVRLRLVDPKGTELQDFESDAHTEGPVGLDAADAIEILETAVGEMQRRYGLMKPARARTIAEYNKGAIGPDRLPWIVVVLDEYADLTSDPNDKIRIEALLRRLTQKARAAGIHVIAATQRPSADVISTTIRSNLPAQLGLRVKTATDSRIILDEAGAESLSGHGDALLRTARGTQRIQVAWCS